MEPRSRKVRPAAYGGGGHDIVMGIDRCTPILINPVTNGLDSIFLVKPFPRLVLLVASIECVAFYQQVTDGQLDRNFEIK